MRSDTIVPPTNIVRIWISGPMPGWAQFGFLLGWQALLAPPVTWKPGDEFEAARKKSIER